METWECVQTVEAYPAGSDQYIRRLQVCGSTLVGGSYKAGEVRVWDLEILRPLRTLILPAGDFVRSFVWDRRVLWEAIGQQVVAWGRLGATGGELDPRPARRAEGPGRVSASLPASDRERRG